MCKSDGLKVVKMLNESGPPQLMGLFKDFNHWSLSQLTIFVLSARDKLAQKSPISTTSSCCGILVNRS